MHRSLRKLCAAGIAALAVIQAAPAAASAPAHPRLLFTPVEIERIRARVAGGSDRARAWAGIVASRDAYEHAPPESFIAEMGATNAIAELGLLTHVGAVGSETAQALRGLVLAVTRARDVDRDDFASSLRLRAMALGYDLAYDVLDPRERDEIRTAIRASLAYMPREFNYYRYAFNPFTSNRGATVGAAIGLAALAIWPETPPAEHDDLTAALDFGHSLVRECLTDNLAPDGAYREGVLYGAWALRMVIPYIEARKRFDGVDLGRDPRLERVAEWLVYEVLPQGGGYTNNVNDSPLFSRPLAVHSTYLDWAQTRYGSVLARWLYAHVAGVWGWDAGRSADRVATVLWSRDEGVVDPATILPASRLFAARGLFVHRSGWKTGAAGHELLFSFYAGRFTGGHAQEDQGQFTLYANGDRYVVDNGAVYPTLRPKESNAHNIVLVDGLGQHNAGLSVGTDAQIEASLLAPLCDWVRADLESAYRTHSPLNDPGIPWPDVDWSWGYDGGNPLERAQRTALVVRGSQAPTWILIADDIQKDSGPHSYAWQLHTDAANRITGAVDAVEIHGANGRLCVWFASPGAASLALDARPFTNGGEDPSTTRLVASARAVAPQFVVAMVPLPRAAVAPQVTSRSEPDATELQVTWEAYGVTDCVVANRGSEMTSGVVRTDGRLAVVRTSGAGIVGWALAEGRDLRYGSLQLATLQAPGSLTYSGTTLHVDRAGLGFDAWGPQVTRVVAPEGDIAFVRDGDWIRPAGRWAGPEEPSRPRDGSLGLAIALGCRIDPAAAVAATIHDVRGRRVRVLNGTALARSRRELAWDGRDDRGVPVASGVYFARVEACGRREIRRVTVVR